MITVEQVLSWDPCEGYDEDTLQEIATKIDIDTVNTTAELIRRLQGVIPTPDILWLVFREELIPTKTLHELSCWFAAAALHREREHGREPDSRSWRAVETKWRWTQGRATDGEIEAAREAARAARAAAREAAGAAAWVAEAAWAAGAAAWEAAEAAAREAAGAAAWVAEAAWAARAAARAAAWVAEAAAWVAEAAAEAVEAAAREAAWEEQLKMVLSLIEGRGE